MATSVIQPERIRTLNARGVRDGRYVLYWMQASQRAEDNHALEHAIREANKLDRPLLVGFGLSDDYPEANARHYLFMLEGLRETQTSLARRGIKMVVQRGAPDEVALRLGADAALAVVDRGYLGIQKRWRRTVAERLGCRLLQVEDNVVVPVELVSDKREYAARTIRPKIGRHLQDFLIDLTTTPVARPSLALEVAGEDLSDPEALAERLDLDRSVAPLGHFYRGGTRRAKAALRRFLDERFGSYQEHRNQPHTDDVSQLSMYLHFGHVSPLYVAQQIRHSGGAQVNVQGFIEELVVRRELAMNFTNFTPDYDAYSCLPEWARKTLDEHRHDRREHLYTRAQLENAETHDRYWNAAMREMRFSGYMHNYMRMYWGKKILEWSPSPEEAFETALRLNNSYFLDGRDPNSFAGVAWCFGNHDRPWGERAIFGKVRYMNARGLERKADPEAYVAKVERLLARARG